MAWIGLPDGSQWISDEVRGGSDSHLGLTVADRLLATGAAELLRAAETQVRQ